MQIKGLLMVLAGALLVGCGSQTEEDPTVQYLNALIQPVYVELVDSAGHFNQQTRSFCEKPSEQAFSELQLSWRDVMGAWQRAEAFGQVYLQENMETWRFQFWPDNKNLVGRKVEQLLKAGVPETLVEESVILQGLSAAEYLLFDPNASYFSPIEKTDTDKNNRCRLMVGVSGSLLANAEEISGYWFETGRYYNRLTSTSSEAALELPVLVVNSLDVLVARQVKEVSLPLGTKRQNYYLAESWRSEQSLTNIGTSVASARKMLLFLSQHSENSDEWNVLQEGLKDVADQLEILSPSFNKAFAEQRVEEVKALHVALTSLQAGIGRVAERLEIPLGFNATDGD